MRQYHSLCVFEDSEAGRVPIYNKVAELLVEGWGIIYAAEPNVGSVINRMIKATGAEIESYIEKGALVIADSNSFYSPEKNVLGSQELLDKWHGNILKLRKNGFEKILGIGTAGVFLQEGEGDQLTEYEQVIGTTFAISLEAICCYSQKDAAYLAPVQIISILNSHECTLHDGWRYRHWQPNEIVNAIARGLNRSLGQSASELIFHTLKIVYKLDDTSIVYEPEHLENAIKRLFRDSSAPILQGISREFIAEMSYSKAAA